MPILECACCACSHEFETLVRGAETPSCEGCGSAELEKKLSVGHPNGPGSCALN